MKVFRYFGVAFDSINAHKMRAILTMLGIIIGIAAVLTTVGMGSGAAADITERIESGGTNLLTVSAGGGGSSSTLTMTDAEALADRATHPDLGLVAPEFSSNATLVNGSTETSNQVYGVTPIYADVRSMTVADGAFLSDEQVEAQERVVVLGSTTASDLFGSSAAAIAQRVRINNEAFLVVGVLEEEGGRNSVDDQAFVPISVAQGRLFNADRYRGTYTITGISIQAASSEVVDAAELQIERTLRMRHGLDAETENDFSIFNQASLLEIAGDVSGTLSALLGSIGAVSLLVGGIGIMNIMLVSVTERTREIGLRKALGAHDSDIMLQFLVEALVLTFIGGLIGIGISYGLSRALANVPFIPFSIIIEPWSVVLALAVATASGFIFGLYPAMRATKLDPIEALRYE